MSFNERKRAARHNELARRHNEVLRRNLDVCHMIISAAARHEIDGRRDGLAGAISSLKTV